MDNTFLSYATSILGKTSGGLTGTEIANQSVKFSMQFDTPIEFSEPRFHLEEGQLVTKRNALKMNLECFTNIEQFFIIRELCRLKRFNGNEEVKKLQITLLQRFSELDVIKTEDEILDYEIINRTKHWLEDFSKASKCYNEAIEIYQLKTFDRNLLDNLRLALELLLKEIFQNKKPLEKQIQNIGTLVNKAGGSKEYINMFLKLIEYYQVYQNTYVKHNDNVNSNEIEFIVELTSIFMKQLVKMNAPNH